VRVPRRGPRGEKAGKRGAGRESTSTPCIHRGGVGAAFSGKVLEVCSTIPVSLSTSLFPAFPRALPLRLAPRRQCSLRQPSAPAYSSCGPRRRSLRAQAGWPSCIISTPVLPRPPTSSTRLSRARRCAHANLRQPRACPLRMCRCQVRAAARMGPQQRRRARCQARGPGDGTGARRLPIGRR